MAPWTAKMQTMISGLASQCSLSRDSSTRSHSHSSISSSGSQSSSNLLLNPRSVFSHRHVGRHRRGCSSQGQHSCRQLTCQGHMDWMVDNGQGSCKGSSMTTRVARALSRAQGLDTAVGGHGQCHMRLSPMLLRQFVVSRQRLRGSKVDSSGCTKARLCLVTCSRRCCSRSHFNSQQVSICSTLGSSLSSHGSPCNSHCCRNNSKQFISGMSRRSSCCRHHCPHLCLHGRLHPHLHLRLHAHLRQHQH